VPIVDRTAPPFGGAAERAHVPLVDVIVPARNAASTLGAVLAAIPPRRVRGVMVVDNGSTDATSQIARDAGVVVVRQSRGGYGAACQVAIAHEEKLPAPPEIVVFVPGDGSADPAELPGLLRPIEEDAAELTLAVAARGNVDRAVARLIGTVYRHPVRAVGTASAMRAIRFPALVALGMRDKGGGWDVEMLVRALKLGLIVVEVPVEARGPAAVKLADRGRSLFHILRHATMR